MTTLTVALITKNAEATLDKCLASVKDLADEIIILDSGSQDQTLEIAARYQAKIYSNTQWPGFGRQRQIAQEYASGDWILWLDSDEELSPELQRSIKNMIEQYAPDAPVIFRIPRLSWAFGRFIHHCGWYPDYVIRLYPRKLTQYNDAKVHESVAIPTGCAVQTLSGDLWHYTYQGLNDYLAKSLRYADDWAKAQFKRGKKSSLFSAVMRANVAFFKSYFLKKGFLDRRAGLKVSLITAQYTFYKYFILATLHDENSAD